MIVQIVDHLWQSTLVLGLAGLLTLLLHENSAGARYWLWFAASVKFLIPLSPLAALTNRLSPLPAVPMLSAPASELAQRVSFPSTSAVGPAAVPAADLSTVLLAIWGAGCAAVLLSWFIRWRRIRRAMSSARPLSLQAAIPLRESPTLMEPGLVGLWNPVILLPTGLAQRLTPAEIQGILAHELCHYRRRDNLTSAVHMLVEVLFWFYPPIWWLGARLIVERERACDESVLAAGNDAEIYVEGILKVCRFFRQSAMACTAGVSGADLRRRVEEIMSGRRVFPVGRAKKLLVTLSIAGSVFGMILFGALPIRVAQAQTSSSSLPTPVERAKLIYEPKQVPFNAADFDKFVGYYRHSTPALLGHVFRNGDHYYWQFTGNPPFELSPESPTKFFVARRGMPPADISFVTGPEGRVTEMISSVVIDGRINTHLSGTWPRSSKSEYDAAEAELQQRMEENIPSPGTQAFVRRWIQSEERGHANYGDMVKEIADAARAQAPQTLQDFRTLGAFRSLTFVRVTANGADVYEGTFANGNAGFYIAPLTTDGKVEGWSWRVLGRAHQPEF